MSRARPEFVSVSVTEAEASGAGAGGGAWRPAGGAGGSFQPRVHLLEASAPGPLPAPAPAPRTEAELFKLLVSPALVDHIVTETNRHYRFAVNNLAKVTGRIERWVDTCADEIYLFIAVCMLMGRNSRNSLHEHWSTDPLFYSPIYSDVISRNRFQLLMRMLHFADNETPDSSDSLFKIRDVVEELRKSFKDNFYPYRDLCVYESLEFFKGHLLVSQNMPIKTKFLDIRLYVICDCRTGYVLDYNIYTTPRPEIKSVVNLENPEDVVMSLISPYLDCGHNLYIDKQYSSPRLFETLHERKTNVCGTVRSSKINIPEFEIDLMKNKYVMAQTDNIIAIKWAGAKNITVMSTMHSNNFCKTGKVHPATKKDTLKPACIVDYEKVMGKLDRSDMVLSSMDSVKKCIKWYKKIFFHLVELCLFNAYKIYQEQSGKLSMGDFQTEIIKQLIQSHRLPESCKKKNAVVELLSRLTDRHFTGTIPSTSAGTRTSRKCHVCSRTSVGVRKRRETRYMCKQCNIPLCLIPCFEIYHTVKDY